MNRTGPSVINPAKSPPLYVPIGLMLSGLASLLFLQWYLFVKAPMIFGEYRFNSATLAATHLFTLGFATSIMMGAFYQITPVMLIAQAVRGAWAIVQGLFFLTGVGLMIAGFHYGETHWIAWGGSFTVAAVCIFLVLIARTMRTATAWTISGTYMIAGLSFLAGTAFWGLTLAFNLRYNFLGSTLQTAPLSAHLVVGLGGWFMLTIFGVSYQLVPMFALTNRPDDQSPKRILWLLTSGLWIAFGLLLFGVPERYANAALLPVLAGVIWYGIRVGQLLRARRRPALDLGMRYALVAFGFLALSLLLGLIAATGLAPGLKQTPGPTAIIWFGLFGFVGSMILGMMYKIIPFLFWHWLLKRRTDKTQRLPNLVQMYSEKLAEAGFWCWTSGVLGTGLVLLAGALGLLYQPALWARWPILLVASGTLLFAWTIGEVLRARPLS